MSKYPPAEPEALRLLAPQRGLIATAKAKQRRQQAIQRYQRRNCRDKHQLPETSNSYCLPGKAGGPPCFASDAASGCSVVDSGG